MLKKLKLKFIISFIICIFASKSVYADWVRQDNGRYKYFNSAVGQYVTNNWLQTGNGFYFFDSNGISVVGWYLINGYYYYFDDTGLMKVGFIDFNGKRYYLNPKNGQMVTGWIQTYTDGVIDYYYFRDDGSMLLGWQQIDGKWYYFYDGKCLIDTFAAVNGTWYHFGVTGAMDTGWVNANGKMFFFNQSNGALTKGWIQDYSGNEYYLSEADGSLAVNTTLQIGGIYYTFDSQGKCIDKNQYSSIGNMNGDSSAIGAANGILGIVKNSETVYGVNIGVSPGSAGVGVGGTTSFEYARQQSEPLQVGSTQGPK